MRITRIEPQKRKSDRCNVYVDGSFAVGVSKETLLRLALRTGDELGPDALKALQATEALVSAKGTALRYLAVRPRTIREIRDRLRESEFSDEEIQQVIDELTQAGLLNDEAFARAYIRDTASLRPSGPIRIIRKLLLLGIPRDVIDNALAAETGATDQRALALDAAKRQLSKLPAGKDPRATRAKLSGFLARRGFTWDIITDVLRTLGHDDEGSF